MKTKFGSFEEVENADYVKQKLLEFFAPSKSDKYSDVYIAYPHQCFSEQYQPENPSDAQLELYIYSVPENVKAEPGRAETMRFGGANVAPVGGQRDCLKILSLPKDFASVEDELGNTISISSKNQIWVLFDICHGLSAGNASSEEVFNAYMTQVSEGFLNPPTSEELEERAAVALQGIIDANFGESNRKLKDDVDALSSEVASAQQRFAELVRKLARSEEMFNLAKQRGRPDARVMLRKVKSFPWVASLNLKSGMISVETKPISAGPFQFGSWKISLGKDIPIMKHEVQGKCLHPYEWDETHNNKYCLGGFAHDYAYAMSRGDIVEAFSLAKLEITSYDVSTKMTPIEKFFTAIMGKRSFDKILDSMMKEHEWKNSDGAQILSISGHEVRYCGYKIRADGTYASTKDQAVVEYE